MIFRLLHDTVDAVKEKAAGIMTDQAHTPYQHLFNLHNRVVLILGGSGTLGEAMAHGLGHLGAKIAVAGRQIEKVNATTARLSEHGIETYGVAIDAMNKESILAGLNSVESKLGPVRVLINAVGGNQPGATVSPQQSFFDLPAEALSDVVGLNLFGGAILPCQVVGFRMKEHGEPASIINISSMSGLTPLTRVVGYGAAKAAVNNFTQWLAVHMAHELEAPIRVNAIAPGFFLSEQNRFLLTTANGGLTERGETILAHTPMSRFGHPDDLIGAAAWLASDASAFVTGIVVPVDGGFSAFSGV